MRWLGICAACILLAIPTFAQDSDFQQLLSGKDIPLSLKLKDLDSTWRHLGVTSPDNQKNGLGDLMSQILPMAMMSGKGGGKGTSDEAMGMAFMSALFGGGGSHNAPVYYTKGQTVTLGGETFLVAYQTLKKEVNFMQLILESQQNGGKEPDLSKLTGEKLSGDSELSLALLNLKNITSLSDIRPFDLQKEIDESSPAGGSPLSNALLKATNESKRRTCRANLQTIAHAEQAYLLRDSNPNHVYTPNLKALLTGPKGQPGDLQALPVCPDGGTYSVDTGPNNNGPITIHCSIPEHDDNGHGGTGYQPGRDSE